MEKKYLIIENDQLRLATKAEVELTQKSGDSATQFYQLKPVQTRGFDGWRVGLWAALAVLGILVVTILWKNDQQNDQRQHQNRATLLQLETAEGKRKEWNEKIGTQRAERDSLARAVAKNDVLKTQFEAKQVGVTASLETIYAKLVRAKPAERTQLKQKEAELTRQKDDLEIRIQQAVADKKNTESRLEKNNAQLQNWENQFKKIQLQIDSLSRVWEKDKNK